MSDKKQTTTKQKPEHVIRCGLITHKSLKKLKKAKKRDPVKDLADALDAATKNLVRQRSHFSYSQLLYETFLEAPSRAIDPKTIPEAVQQHIKNDESILKLGGVDGQMRYTTAEMLYREQCMLLWIRPLKERAGLQVSEKVDRQSAIQVGDHHGRRPWTPTGTVRVAHWAGCPAACHITKRKRTAPNRGNRQIEP